MKFFLEVEHAVTGCVIKLLFKTAHLGSTITSAYRESVANYWFILQFLRKIANYTNAHKHNRGDKINIRATIVRMIWY